jgi:hypothetical protein
MSGRQTPADLARELLEEIDIVGALGRPADQFIDLMGAESPPVTTAILPANSFMCAPPWGTRHALFERAS